MVAQVPRGGLTSVEHSLVEHVGRGEWLDLVAKGKVLDEAAMRSSGDVRTCRATVIRDILRGRLVPDPDPHGCGFAVPGSPVGLTWRISVQKSIRAGRLPP